MLDTESMEFDRQLSGNVNGIYNSNLTLKVFSTKEKTNDDKFFGYVKDSSTTSEDFKCSDIDNCSKYIPKAIIIDSDQYNYLRDQKAVEDKKVELNINGTKEVNTSTVYHLYVSRGLYRKLDTTCFNPNGKSYLELEYHFIDKNTEDEIFYSFTNLVYELVDTTDKHNEFNKLEQKLNRQSLVDKDMYKETDYTNQDNDEDDDVYRYVAPYKSFSTVPTIEIEENRKKQRKRMKHMGYPSATRDDVDEVISTIEKEVSKNYAKLTKKEKQEAFHYPDTAAYNYIIDYFTAHGVTVREMAKEARDDQLKHGVKAPLHAYIDAINNTLHKRDIDSIILVGLALDELCEKGLLPEPLQSIMENDAPSFSPDETLTVVLALTGSGIAVTNFGARDVHKHGLAKRVDQDEKHCNVFLDDFVSGLIAKAESVVAHNWSF